MNFLQLAQTLRQEAGASGSGPANVTGVVGESKRLVDWVNRAWLEIQGMHDVWDFMRKQFSFAIPQATGQFSPTQAGITDFRFWHRETFRAQRTALGSLDEQWLVEWEYQTFRNTYRFNAQRNSDGRPMVFAIYPNGKDVMFGPLPSEAYTVVGEYQRLPSSLVNADDAPDLPEHLQIAIVYKALEYYGFYESAGEVVQRAKTQFVAIKAQLEREMLPAVHLGNPLA
jgi:hypothetical protein